MRLKATWWGVLGLSCFAVTPGACTVDRNGGSAAEGGAAAGSGAAGAAEAGAAEAGASGRGDAGSGGQNEGGSAPQVEAGANAQGGIASQGGAATDGGSAGTEGGAPSVSVCGDGVVAGLEQCDDRNSTSGDGCSAACKVETGWTCVVGSLCKPICGDKLLVGAEPCDDGNAINTDSCTNQCICGVGLTGAHCELERFVVLTPSDVTLDSVAFDTNADGSVVTGEQAYALFVWTQATGSKVPTFGSSVSSSVGRAINADGSVVVGQAVLNTGAALQQAFRWSQATGMIALNAAGTTHEDVRDVSGDGTIVIGVSDRFGTDYAPFRWTSAGGMTQMAAVSDASDGQPVRLSRDGSTVLGYGRNNSRLVPVRWSGSALGQSLAVPLEYDAGRLFAATSDGATLFGSYDVVGASTAFTWTQAGGLQILMQSALQLKAFVDVSGDGSVLVGNTEAGAFVWKLPDGKPELLATVLQAQGANLNGLSLYTTAISSDGNVIVGYASTSSSSLKVAFLARWR